MKIKPNDLICQNTYNALKLLVNNCYYSQTTSPQYCQSDLAASKEMYTVCLKTSRQSGHSTALAKLGVEYFNDAIFLSCNLAMAKSLKDKVQQECIKENGTAANVFPKITAQHIETLECNYYFGSINSIDSLRGISSEAILIDGTFGLSPSQKDKIYKDLLPSMINNPQKFFIFVE